MVSAARPTSAALVALPAAPGESHCFPIVKFAKPGLTQCNNEDLRTVVRIGIDKIHGS